MHVFIIRLTHCHNYSVKGGINLVEIYLSSIIRIYRDQTSFISELHTYEEQVNPTALLIWLCVIIITGVRIHVSPV